MGAESFLKMFDESFIEQFANRVADMVTARINKPAVEKRYLRIELGAEYADYSPEAFRKHIERGHIPVSKEGKSTRVDKLEIDKWMARNRQ
jgi:hypothetical protein